MIAGCRDEDGARVLSGSDAVAAAAEVVARDDAPAGAAAAAVGPALSLAEARGSAAEAGMVAVAIEAKADGVAVGRVRAWCVCALG